MLHFCYDVIYFFPAFPAFFFFESFFFFFFLFFLPLFFLSAFRFMAFRFEPLPFFGLRAIFLLSFFFPETFFLAGRPSAIRLSSSALAIARLPPKSRIRVASCFLLYSSLASWYSL